MSIYRFGPFEVRTRVRELYRSGTKVRLRGQPFQLLQALLNHPGEVVTREQMRDELWPSDTFVDFEHGINASLRKLRQSLGDSAVKPLYIETLPGVGYRFIAPFETVEEPPARGAEPDVGQPPISDEIEEDEEGEQLEPVTVPVWRRWIAWALAGGAVVLFGLLLLTARWNRRVVHGATANLSDAQSAFNSPLRASDQPGAESGNGNASLHSSAPMPVNQSLSPIQGKVWVVSVAQASNVTFPSPNSIPDATFTTNGIAYIGWEPDNCYTLATFLAQCANRGFELKFSGLANPNLGGTPAGPDTSMSGRTWGILVEFTGTDTCGAVPCVGVLLSRLPNSS